MINRKSFYYMRHGTTEWNLQGILQGQTDIPLHELGIQEARNAIVAHDGITHVFYSPLQRAKQTMHIVTEHMNCSKEELREIQEWHLGAWEGKPRGTFDQVYRTICPPGGESWAQFRERVVQAINIGLAKSDCPLFVAHGGVFRALIDVLGIEHARLNNCDVVKFVALHDSDRWHVEKQKLQKE